jgi:asparagine synthase (glutamine-hydrolysing)
MDHSIESRVPFLDYRLVEFAFMLPDEWKIRDVTTKYILRACMKGILPETIRNRKDKIGFKTDPNLTFDFARRHSTTLVDNRTDLEFRFFKPASVERMINSTDHSVEEEFALWRVINTKLWARQFWCDGEKIV